MNSNGVTVSGATSGALQIAEIALNVAKAQTSGTLQEGLTVGALLLQIIEKAIQLHEDSTGQPLDLSLIRPETT